VEAQVKSLGVQDDVMQQLLQNFNDFKPMQLDSMAKGLKAQELGQQQYQEDRQYALGRRDLLTGVQDKIVKQASDFDQDARAAELAQQANESITQSFDQARGQTERALAARGVNANSGAAIAALGDTTTKKALAVAGAANQSRQQARAEGIQLTDRANADLSGYPAMGTGIVGASAGLGANAVGVANSGVAGINSTLQGVGQNAAQMGSNATGMYNAQANFNLQNQKLQNDDPLMGMLGSAMGSYARSDVNAKTKIGGLRPGKALAMVIAMKPGQEWQYKKDSDAADGGKRHIGPMAQDVQRVAGDKVAPGGKAIDLVSLNGINMAATADLAQEVKSLRQEVARLKFKGGLRREMAHA
jgi:hypothetical protein